MLGGQVTLGIGACHLLTERVIVGGAELHLAQGILNLNQGLEVTGGGTLEMEGSYIYTPAVQVRSGGILSGTGTIVGDVTLEGRIEPAVPAGPLQISGRLTATTSSRITVAQGTVFRVGTAAQEEFQAEGQLVIQQGGVLEVQSSHTVVGGTTLLEGGTLRSLADLAGTRASITLTGELWTKGVVDAHVDTTEDSYVSLTGPATLGASPLTGAVTVKGALSLSTHTLTCRSAGLVQLHGATTLNGGTLGVTAPANSTPLVDLGSTGTLDGFGTLSALGGVQAGPGTTVRVSGGTLSCSTAVALLGDVHIAAGAALVVQAHPTNDHAYAFFNNLHVDGGSLTLNVFGGNDAYFQVDGSLTGHGDLQNAYALTASPGSHIEPDGHLLLGSVATSGTLLLNTGCKVTAVQGLNVNVNGVLSLRGGTLEAPGVTEGLSVNGGQMEGHGTIATAIRLDDSEMDVGPGGALHVAGPITGFRSKIILNGSALNAAGGIDLQGGSTLAGNGTINGDVVTDGVIAPGASPGTLEINGTLTCGSSSMILLEMSGTAPAQKDLLIVHGSADLAGGIVLSFSNGFAPHTGDQFALMSVDDSVTGAFEVQHIEGLAPGFQYNLQPQGGVLVLTALNDGVSIPTYATWAATSGLLEDDLAYDADPDNDGIPNLMEYGFNLPPLQPQPAPLIPGTGTSGLPAIRPRGNGGAARLTVEYLRRRNSAVFYTVQFTSTLDEFGDGWEESTRPPTVAPIDSVWERVIIEDEQSIATAPRRFARLVLNKP